MDSKEALTAPEVAELLNITKNTVYEIVKRGEIPAYKIGKKLRIDRQDVDDYINNQNGGTKGTKQYNIIQGELASPTAILSNNKDIIISGQDYIMDILADKISESVKEIRVLRSNIGSYTSLFQLYNNEISMCSVHLWDGDTNEYNTAFVRKLLPGISCIIINLAYRMQGFYVAKGNPHNIKTWSDLTKPEISMINREKGSGTRVLLDEKLRLHNIDVESIKGYNEEKNTHISVASSIARGEGDVGLGTEKVAGQVQGIDFVPIQEERYDLVIKSSYLKEPVYKLIVEIIQSQDFKNIIEGIGGYNLKEIGKILAKT
jgi:putative molybdopterin biosynthesis protein